MVFCETYTQILLNFSLDNALANNSDGVKTCILCHADIDGPEENGEKKAIAVHFFNLHRDNRLTTELNKSLNRAKYIKDFV